ncbi:hypothetical protein BC939DRAFT_489535 [Gamsiella multidivaricata]|uniref:uncharacterized protein n=1 Tax=Gamsiella multidivaricata TaxID=101098 RepID=UPI002220827A|nr:uncharacterized protein BC939DRAFT_489535 [Gamsiella multidivaricata]KAG0359500.1 hypothetical protein BGZ54_009932 [Gamsiella multidivaricata]KAI7831307.1 hypothetical protein BC939DRAFT_489535 [Gamsiella multidivaricata]
MSSSPVIHSYSPGTLIYEVNLSVPKENEQEYLVWLRDFTKEQVHNIPGFVSSMVFYQPKPYGLHWLSEEGNDKVYLTAHYVIASQADLDAYLAENQAKVASAEQDRFEFLVTSRRTLSVVC